MRALTTTEMEHCAGGAPAQNGFIRPENRSLTAYGPQGDKDNQNPSRNDFLATTRGPMHGGYVKPT